MLELYCCNKIIPLSFPQRDFCKTKAPQKRSLERMMGVEPDLQFVYVLKNKGKTPAFGKVPLYFPWFALYIFHRLDAGADFFISSNRFIAAWRSLP